MSRENGDSRDGAGECSQPARVRQRHVPAVRQRRAAPARQGRRSSGAKLLAPLNFRAGADDADDTGGRAPACSDVESGLRHGLRDDFGLRVLKMLQKAPKFGPWRKAHGSICVQEAHPSHSPTSPQSAAERACRPWRLTFRPWPAQFLAGRAHLPQFLPPRQMGRLLTPFSGPITSLSVAIPVAGGLSYD
jgi:hypothetical protein